MKDLKIVFMGTPDFAVGVLKELIVKKKKVVGVVTAPDKPTGRGRKTAPSAVKEFATTQNLKIMQPHNLKNLDFLDELKALEADLYIVVAFRMLPEVVWKIPKYGTFNLHASLLPQYRGAAPIHWAIINGEEKTGVTTFFIDEKIDTGNIILKRETPISKTETVGSLHDKLMDKGSELVLETVALIEAGKLSTQVQTTAEGLKMAPKLNPENTRIQWEWPVSTIERFVRGLCPHPTAWTILQMAGEEIKMKIYSGRAHMEKHKYAVGTVFAEKNNLKIAGSDGFYFIEELQIPGKRKMEVISFLNGFSFEKNSKLF